MTAPRSYGDPCGIARALDVVGERWALLAVRELLLGDKRFGELRAGLPGVSPNVLAQRLRELAQCGVVERRGSDYALTDWGRELHPILVQLGRWGARSPARPGGALSVDALLIALEATFDEARADGLTVCLELRLRGEPFTARVEGGVLALVRGAPRAPDAVWKSDPQTLRAVVFGGQKLSDSHAELSGDRARARAFLACFRRPAPVAS